MMFDLPLFAQSDAGQPGDQTHKLYLPLVVNGIASVTEPVTGQEDSSMIGQPAVLDINISAKPVEGQTKSSAARLAVQNRALPTAFFDLMLASPVAMLSGQQTQVVTANNRPDGVVTQQVIVRLNAAPLAVSAVTASGVDAVQAQMQQLQSQQASVIQQATALDPNAKVLGSVQNVLNAVMLETNAATLQTLASNPNVQSIEPAVNYAMDLSETVPYIGATIAQQAGFTGAGVRIAVLDNGIDYLHADLGGAGNPADFSANDPDVIEPGTFPTAKVIGGYDFVGGTWTGTAGGTQLVPDSDPLDAGLGRGHGTHVADIIGGASGVAPGALLYAVKVCSSVSSACSGIALLQGMDFAVDPNHDLNFDDRVDIINLSLGAPYSSAFDDDLSQAVENASKLGVLTVASAGNNADKPFVVGTPAAAPSALAVAQTNVPSAYLPLMEITAPSQLAARTGVVYQPWSAPLINGIEAPVQYGNGNGGNLNGCAAFPANALQGKIVLVDRGSCNMTLKIKNIGNAGGLLGLVGLTAPGDPFVTGDDGQRPITIPGFVISQLDANTLKQADTVTVRFDPAQRIGLVGHMVASSSRGPEINAALIKPDIGAPGALVSALAGSGNGVSTFGGTSGAAPLVTGAAALVKQAHPERTAAEIKAVLMNTAETNIMDKPALFGGDLAPITRIGGGEVRVAPALLAPAAAWDVASQSGSLSFGFQDVAQDELELTHTVNVRNYSEQALVYQLNSSFRFVNDELNGAVRLTTPDQVVVPAHGDVQFAVTMHIDGRFLRSWTLNSGTMGADGNELTLLEYDGYLNLTEIGNASNALHLAWHVLPRKASDITLKPATDGLMMRNRGVAMSNVASFSLIGVSDNLPAGLPGMQNPTPDFKYLGYATYPVAAGVCGASDSFVLGFAINTWERQMHANSPASFEIWLDTNQDGTYDYKVLTRDASFNNVTDGRNLTWVVDLATGDISATFFTDHDINSANTVMLLCADQIGMNATDFFHPINVKAVARDFYFGGNGDTLTGMTISPLGEQYVGLFASDANTAATLLEDSNDSLHVADYGAFTNSTETGLLLLFRNGALLDAEAGTAIVTPNAR
ncbi:MAG: S8 family serine peptidase [Chloroflexi bacterium]|nr:S8 family serine peptidase [Chloroflexota bacterium]